MPGTGDRTESHDSAERSQRSKRELSPKGFLEQLDEALDGARFDDVRELIDRIDPTGFTDKQTKTALGHVRRKRLFAELEKAAGVFYFAGSQRLVVRRQWAQALLDQGRIEQGLAALRSAEKAAKSDPAEGPEIRGLIGRAYKQRFVNEGENEDLRKAIRAYRGDWLADQENNRWHGINLVALLARARRDGQDIGAEDEDPIPIAARILDDITELEDPRVWDYGTAQEAAVALGDQKLALKWAKKYVRHPAADAFELGSTLRQLSEVWQLEGSELGNLLLPVLEYQLGEHQGSSFGLSNSAPSSAGFEAVYGSEGAIPLGWTDTMHERCRSIARVFDSDTQERWGTGFLVKGSSIVKSLGDAVVFATNSHVVSNNPADKAPLGPGEGSAEFTRLSGSPKVPLGKLLFTSTRRDLDISILEIEPPPKVKPLPVTKFAPAVPEDEQTQRVYIAGHPQGRALEVTLYDNNVAEYESPFVRYRSPTEGGHSGSPVFNRKWRAFAIHHRAREEKQLNEGVLFEAIQKLAT